MQHVAYLPYCVASLLLLNFLVYTSAAGLLPYGAEYGDTEREDLQDDSLETVYLSRPVQFNGEWYPNATFTTNGGINFDDTENYNNGFPIPDDHVINNIVAALWTDLYPGKMFYREETDTAVLMEAGRFVKESLGVCDFEPVWAFIVTWLHFKENEYGDYGDLNFQAALVANDSTAYALMLYDEMNIPNNIMGGTIGVHSTTGDTREFVELCEGALGDIIAGRKQSQCQSMTGVRAFRIDVIKSAECIKALDDTKGCTDDKGCTNSLCPLCDTRSGNCVECIKCTSDDDCITNGRPHCDEKTGCCKGCPAGVKGITVKGCAKPGNLGGPCVDGKCTGRSARCNLSTDRCMCHGKYNPYLWYKPRYRGRYP